MVAFPKYTQLHTHTPLDDTTFFPVGLLFKGSSFPLIEILQISLEPYTINNSLIFFFIKNLSGSLPKCPWWLGLGPGQS